MITIKPTTNLWAIATNGVTYIPLAIAKGQELATAMPMVEEYLDRDSFLIRLDELRIEYGEEDFIIEEVNTPANWDNFNAQMLSHPRFVTISTLAFQTHPMVSASVPTALLQVSTHGVNSFNQIWNLFCHIGKATPEDRIAWADLGIDNNLPDDFITVLRG